LGAALTAGGWARSRAAKDSIASSRARCTAAIFSRRDMRSLSASSIRANSAFARAASCRSCATSLAVVAGCVVLAFFFYVLALISVPAIVFFPAYSIYFFAGRYPALRTVMYPAPPAPEIPPTPANPPEMPPSAEPIS